MEISKEAYARMVKQAAPKSHHAAHLITAFAVGGTICGAGQLLLEFWKNRGFPPENAGALASVSLIALSVLLTGCKVYDSIARFAGAGTLVPITGFANAVASPAMEFRREGFVLGTGVKMFSIAGPVILYGTLASVIYGVILWLLSS